MSGLNTIKRELQKRKKRKCRRNQNYSDEDAEAIFKHVFENSESSSSDVVSEPLEQTKPNKKEMLEKTIRSSLVFCSDVETIIEEILIERQGNGFDGITGSIITFQHKEKCDCCYNTAEIYQKLAPGKKAKKLCNICWDFISGCVMTYHFKL